MNFELEGKIINIKIVRKSNKNIYMRFQDDQTMIITCNYKVSDKEIKRIIETNKIQLSKMQKQKETEAKNNQYFQYLGKKYRKDFDNKTKEPKFTLDSIIAKDEQTLKKFYQKECQRIFSSEIKRILPSFQNIPFFSLKIRNMKTRWGVNNFGSQTITLNSELLKKDLDLMDYVIIHELCHFYEPNHSPRFWNHVEEYYPKYKEARKRLRG